jgi:hypothetical protein
MKVQLGGKEYVFNLEGLRFKPLLPHFFLINYLHPIGVKAVGPCGGGVGVVGPCGRGTGWRGGADHLADWTELTMYCVYEYKYTKY